MLSVYKHWIKRHPGAVQNLDWLLYLTVWSPTRVNSDANTEAKYEMYHAAIGLLSLWHTSIIEEDVLPTKRPWSSVALDALEQVGCKPVG